MFNKLLHGSLTEVYDLLEDNPMNEQELRAALQNVISHVRTLQRQIASVYETLEDAGIVEAD